MMSSLKADSSIWSSRSVARCCCYPFCAESPPIPNLCFCPVGVTICGGHLRFCSVDTERIQATAAGVMPSDGSNEPNYSRGTEATPDLKPQNDHLSIR